MPSHLAERLDMASDHQGVSQNSLVIMALDRYLAKYRQPLELPQEEESTEWPSTWPKALKCNRCEKLHDPMEHSANKGLLEEARAQAGLGK